MIGHLVAMLVSAVAFFGAILLYGAFSPRRLKGWKFWLCFAVYCALMEGAGPLANGLYSACGILGGGVGRQTLYNVTRYLLLYVLLFRERSMVYLSTTVIFYSWICCIENLVVGATLILQAEAVRFGEKLAVLDQSTIGSLRMRRDSQSTSLSASNQWFTKQIRNFGHHIVGVNGNDRSLAKRILSGGNRRSFPVLFRGCIAVF